MKIAGAYRFEASSDSVWSTLLGPGALATCIPGCQELERVGDDEYHIVLNIPVGPITGRYTGKATLADVSQPSSFKMLVEGSGMGGSVAGEGVLSFREDGGVTELMVEGEARVAGVIARVGQRLIGSVAKMLMDQFFACMKQDIESGSMP